MNMRAKWLTQPKGMSDKAKVVWDELAPAVARAGKLAKENAHLFAILCTHLATIRAAADEISQHGAVIETKSGLRKANPACTVLIGAQRAAERYLREFEVHDGY